MLLAMGLDPHLAASALRLSLGPEAMEEAVAEAIIGEAAGREISRSAT